MTRKTKIHVIGSYAVGMTMRAAVFPQVGETVPGYNFNQFHGGKGSNQAVGAARMGAEVMFTGCVGTDHLGDSALAMLKNEGIETQTVFRTDEYSTGVGFVIVGDSGDNEIVIDLAANDRITTWQIEKAFNSGFNPDIMLIQLEANLDAVYCALKLAKERGIPSILNPAPYRDVSEDFVGLATYITPNQTEGESLLGLKGTPEFLCSELKSKFGNEVILTAGEDGAYYTEDGTVKQSKGFKTVPRDTTGAGDCFNAALAVMLGEGNELSNALEAANFAASCSVQIEGVLESLPYRKTIDHKILRTKGNEA